MPHQHKPHPHTHVTVPKGQKEGQKQLPSVCCPTDGMGEERTNVKMFVFVLVSVLSSGSKLQLLQSYVFR